MTSGFEMTIQQKLKNKFIKADAVAISAWLIMAIISFGDFNGLDWLMAPCFVLFVGTGFIRSSSSNIRNANPLCFGQP